MICILDTLIPSIKGLYTCGYLAKHFCTLHGKMHMHFNLDGDVSIVSIVDQTCAKKTFPNHLKLADQHGISEYICRT